MRALAAGLVAISLAPPARAAEESPRLRVRASPSPVVLGPGARASIAVDGADGTPALTASVGAIANVRAAGPGSFEADWIPPAEAYPRVAIVSAVSGARAGWVALPLVGTGVAVARAVPGSLIRVTIGEKTFGPARTDRSGEARVRVVVPPGIATARHGETELDLKVPASRHVHLAAGAAAVPADREALVTLHAFAVDAAGIPRPSAPLDVSVSEGRIEGIDEIAPGWRVARWRLAPGPAGIARARAFLRDEPGVEAAVDVSRAPGPAARVEIEPSVRRAVAGDQARVLLRLRVVDAAGNAVAVHAVPRVDASFGALDAVEQVAPGTFAVGLAVPERLDGRRRADVRADVAGISGEAAIELAPAAPERLVVAAPDAPVLADGAGEARIRAEVLDRFGNEVAELVPAATTAARGEVGTERDPRGGWTVRYRPARVRGDARHDLLVRAGPLDAIAAVSVTAPRTRVALAPKLGFAAGAGGLRSPYLAVEGSGWTPWRDGRVGVAIEIGTFALDRVDRVSAGSSTVSLHGSSRYVPLLASAVWDGGAVGRGRWWAAAGGGAAYVGSSLAVDAEPAVSDGGWVGAAHATGGWGMRVAGGTAFVEARLAWHGAPALDTLHGTLTAFVVALGWRWVAY